jgi:hypothetical protein
MDKPLEKISYEEIIPCWLKAFPEFDPVKYDLDEDDLKLPYIVFSYFSKYLNELIEKEPSSPVIDRVFHVIDSQFNQSKQDKRVLDLIRIEIFEEFSGNNIAIELALKKLKSGKAKFAFKMDTADYRPVKWWNKPFDAELFFGPVTYVYFIIAALLWVLLRDSAYALTHLMEIIFG